MFKVNTMDNVLNTFFNDNNKVDRRNEQKAMLSVMMRLDILLDFTECKI